MALSSYNTTNLGPRVSFTTVKSDPGPVLVYGDSNSTFQWAGQSQLSNLTVSALTATNIGASAVASSSLSGSNVTTASLSVGAAATRLTNALYSTYTVDPASLAANVTSLLSVAVAGATAGDMVFITTGSSCSINFNIRGYCESNNSLTYELSNLGAATQDLSVITIRALVVRATT